MPYVTMTSGPCPRVEWYDLGTTGGYDPWYSWNQTRTWSSNTTTAIWTDWNQPFYATTMGTSTNVITFGQPAAWAMPAEQLYRMDGRPAFYDVEQRTEAEWAEIRAENERGRARRDQLSVEARANAHKLLAMVLTKPQMADYQAKSYFDVVGSEGGVYRIHHGTSGNIRQLIDGHEVNRLCVHPRLYDHEDNISYMPTEDCLAAQALALMHDERGAVSMANVHQGVRHLRAA